MDDMLLTISDDSGFLGLIDPAAYQSFVGEDWTLEQIAARFKTQMAERRLLLWATGREDVWRVRIVLAPSEASGFQELVGPIVSSSGNLLLTSYDSLTMAAQFRDRKSVV